jgi:hypothetical protein
MSVKYNQKSTVTVEIIQFTGQNFSEIEKFVDRGELKRYTTYTTLCQQKIEYTVIYIPFSYGELKLRYNNYLVKYTAKDNLQTSFLVMSENELYERYEILIKDPYKYY